MHTLAQFLPVPTAEAFDSMVHICCIFATIVGAITGATASSRVRMDLIGIVVCGTIVALGGGTLRDVLLSGVITQDGTPLRVYWTTPGEVQYIWQAVITSVIIFYVTRFRALPVGTIRVADAFSMAFFTILGMNKAYCLGLPGVVCCIMGVCTGVAGGAVRDIITGNVPYIFRPKEVYASASLGGCVAYWAFADLLDMHRFWAFALGIVVTFTIRMVSVYHNWTLPSYLPLFDTVRNTDDHVPPPGPDCNADNASWPTRKKP